MSKLGQEVCAVREVCPRSSEGHVFMFLFIYRFYSSAPYYTVTLHAVLNLIFSFTIAFNNNKIIVEGIYTANVNNNILTSKA